MKFRLFFQSVKLRAKAIKSDVGILLFLVKDRRTPLASKLLMVFAIGYLFSPVDLIPDFIPVLGLLDDLILIPLVITAALKLVPAKLLSEARIQVEKEPISKRRHNWIFGAFAILIWVAIVITLVRWLWPIVLNLI